MPAQALLDIRDASRVFYARRGLFDAAQAEIRAVAHVSLTIARGETLGLVGESGCGKSTLGRLIVRLLAPSGGDILLDGRSLFHPPDRADKANAAFTADLPGRLQMVFQDPFSSLNPRLPVGVSVAEPLRARGVPASERRERTLEMLRLVGLAPEYAARFPHEFSGGQRQRIAIARALITHPDLVVCDEAVSALDASIQAQVLNLLADMRERFGLTYVFISHNLEVVGHMSDRVAVMYLGHVVELTARDDLFDAPGHPYTVALIGAVPDRDPARRGRRVLLAGELPSPLNPPPGCPFHPRCPRVMDVCRKTMPPPSLLGPGHTVCCHLYRN
jgi:peptide/nickel transport system ATP-binding protein